MEPVIEKFKIKNEKWRIPLHFIDTPGINPSSSLPLDVLWANNPTAWCYTSLISSKVQYMVYLLKQKMEISRVSHDNSKIIRDGLSLNLSVKYFEIHLNLIITQLAGARQRTVLVKRTVLK